MIFQLGWVETDNNLGKKIILEKVLEELIGAFYASSNLVNFCHEYSDNLSESYRPGFRFYKSGSIWSL